MGPFEIKGVPSHQHCAGLKPVSELTLSLPRAYREHFEPEHEGTLNQVWLVMR